MRPGGAAVAVRVGGPVGLPAATRACVFDLDGVLTDTAKVHAAAWKQMFDGYLEVWAEETRRTFVPFDAVTDYDTYLDGKSRADGIRSFLRSRHLDLPMGAPDDPACALTITTLDAGKNAIVMHRIRRDGVEPYPGSLRYLRAVGAAGLAMAVVSSDANCAEVLRAAGISDLFDTRIDATTVAKQHLAGKPAPDTYLAAAKALGVEPAEAAVFEDALSGVAAGRDGGFGFVVGVDRVGQAADLLAYRADRTVTDLAQLLDPASWQ